MTGLEKTIRMEKQQKHNLKLGNKIIKNLTFNDIVDIKLYMIRYKLKHGEIS